LTDNDSIGDDDESIETFVINSNQVIKMITKTTTITKSTKLLECADPSLTTKGKLIGFPTMAYLWQQDDEQERVCAKPPFDTASCSSWLKT
jgi:hypothetical protein